MNKKIPETLYWENGTLFLSAKPSGEDAGEPGDGEDDGDGPED